MTLWKTIAISTQHGLDLTKKFNDSKGNLLKVQFVMHNDTDNYWVKAQLNEAEGSTT